MLSSIFALSLLLIASDDGKEEAKRLLDAGNQAFEAGEFDAALGEFEKAYRAYPSPKILMNLGEAHRALENWVQAVLHYERFLAASPADEPMIPQVQSRIAELNQKVGRIELAGEGAATIDGAPAEGVVVVVPGDHVVVVRSPGHLDSTQSVAVAAGETRRVEAKLVPVPSAPVEEETLAPVEEESIAQKWWFWTSAGVVVVAVVGVVVGIAVNTGGDDFVPSGELPRTRTSDWESF